MVTTVNSGSDSEAFEEVQKQTATTGFWRGRGVVAKRTVRWMLSRELKWADDTACEEKPRLLAVALCCEHYQATRREYSGKEPARTHFVCTLSQRVTNSSLCMKKIHKSIVLYNVGFKKRKNM